MYKPLARISIMKLQKWGVHSNLFLYLSASYR